MTNPATTRLMMMLGGACSIAAAPVDKDASALGKLLKCRSISEATARLACYDEQAKSVDDAAARHDLVIMDQGQVAAAKRGLFGFPLPRIPLFDARPSGIAPARGDKPVEQDRLDAMIKSVGQSGGRWILVLDDGARWEQVEAGRDADEPRAGMSISIRKASLGSYFARIGSRISMRIRRTG